MTQTNRGWATELPAIVRALALPFVAAALNAAIWRMNRSPQSAA